MRKLARKYPDVTFLIGWGLAQEATLRDPQPNLFRFTPDGAQSSAGLGSYAFRQLGWRRAAVVTEGYNAGLELAAGFVAEFCALGGTIVERDYQSLFAPDPAAAAKRHAAKADGVALLSTYSSPVPYLRRYAAAVGGPLGGRLVEAGSAVGDPTALTPAGHRHERRRARRRHLPGVVGSRAGLVREGIPAGVPRPPPGDGALRRDPGAVRRHGGARARPRADPRQGRPGAAPHARHLELELPAGPVRLDANRQAISRITLQRLGHGADGAPTLEPVRTIDRVTQGFGGIFTSTTPSPSWDAPRCERRTPPPWAR